MTRSKFGIWGRGVFLVVGVSAAPIGFAACGDSGGGGDGSGGAGGTGGTGGTGGGKQDAAADSPGACSDGEFRCVGDKLETCNAELSGFQPVATCKAGMCDAAGKQCDNCTPGDGSCNATGTGFAACDSTGQNEETVTCAAPKPYCAALAKGPACTECKTAADCPPSTNECQVSSCSAEGACGLSPVTKDAPCGATGAGGKCDGAGACVYCQPGDKRCTGLVPEACDAKGQWSAGSACTGAAPLCVAGACVQCQAPSDCPTTTNECLSVACSSGQCGFSPKAQGAACASGAGTCNGSGQCNVCQPGSKTCNGNVPLVCGSNGQYAAQPACTGTTPNCDPATGSCVQCSGASQCPAASSPCLQATCASGTCGFGNKADGAACAVAGDSGTCSAGACKVCTAGQKRCKSGSTTTLQTCDASGQWQDSACGGGTPYCSGGACTAIVCGNGTTDPGEQCDDSNAAKCDGCEGCEKRNWLNVPSTQYVAVPGMASKLPTNSQSACYEGWFRSQPAPAPHPVYIAACVDPGNCNVILLYRGDIPVLRFAVQNGGALLRVDANINPHDGAWHHLAGCRSVSGSVLTLTMFWDGNPVGSATGATSQIGSATALYVGGYDTYKFGISGSADEIRVSNTLRYTTAFTPARRFTADANTVALFHFDEGTGTTATDSSANALSATLVGTSWSPDTGYLTSMCQ